MIYKSETSGTLMFKSDLREFGHDSIVKVGYKVDKVNKVSEIKFTDLPDDIKGEIAKLTNKIARFIEKETRR